MPQEVALDVESFLAVFAHVRLFAGVGPFVDQHGSVGWKVLVAHGADLVERSVLACHSYGSCGSGRLVGNAQFEFGVSVLDVADPFCRGGEEFFAHVAVEWWKACLFIILKCKMRSSEEFDAFNTKL